MALKRAQEIVNELDSEYGLFLVAFETGELEHIKGLLEEFLDLEVDPAELSDPDELASDDGEELEECPLDDDEEENCE